MEAVGSPVLGACIVSTWGWAPGVGRWNPASSLHGGRRGAPGACVVGARGRASGVGRQGTGVGRRDPMSSACGMKFRADMATLGDAPALDTQNQE